jgi:hypothetical protein
MNDIIFIIDTVLFYAFIAFIAFKIIKSKIVKNNKLLILWIISIGVGVVVGSNAVLFACFIIPLLIGLSK